MNMLIFGKLNVKENRGHMPAWINTKKTILIFVRRQIHLKIFEYLTRIVVEQIPLCDLCACSTAPVQWAKPLPTNWILEGLGGTLRCSHAPREIGKTKDFDTLQQVLLC